MDTFFTYTPTTTTTTNTNTMNFPSTTTNTTTAAASSTSSMPSSQYYFPPHDETQTLMQFPYAYPLELVQAGQQGQAFTYPSYPFVIGMNSSQPHLVSDEQQQERRLVDAWTTKVARCKRKMARQKSLCLTKDSASWASSTQMNTQGLAVYDAVDADHVQNVNNVNEDPYTFRTPDNKRLRFLLKKELKNSDVGSLGRIVLPKREAEENLPILSDKDGIQIVIQDVYSNQAWIMKYKYWLNNKSRMYVLENTVDFVKQNGLAIGDSITLYEDELKNLVVTFGFIEGGQAGNVITESVKFGGTYRSLTSEGLSYVKQRIKEVIKAQAAVHRCSAVLDFKEDTPLPYLVMVNAEALYEHAKKVGESLLGQSN